MEVVQPAQLGIGLGALFGQGQEALGLSPAEGEPRELAGVARGEGGLLGDEGCARKQLELLGVPALIDDALVAPPAGNLNEPVAEEKAVAIELHRVDGGGFVRDAPGVVEEPRFQLSGAPEGVDGIGREHPVAHRALGAQL